MGASGNFERFTCHAIAEAAHEPGAASLALEAPHGFGIGRKARDAGNFVDLPKHDVGSLLRGSGTKKAGVDRVRREDIERKSELAIRLDAFDRHDERVARLGTFDVERPGLRVSRRRDHLRLGVVACRVDRRCDHAIPGRMRNTGGCANENVLK